MLPGAPAPDPALPDALAWRPMTVDDVPGLLALCRQVEDADHLSERASVHGLHEMLVGGPGSDPRHR